MHIDMSQFHETYLEEAQEHLEDLEHALLKAEVDGDADIQAIFRAAHSIKGGAGTFGFKEIESFTHVVEHFLQSVRDGEVTLAAEQITAVLQSVDIISRLLDAARKEEDTADILKEGDAVIQQLESFLGGPSTRKKNAEEQDDSETYAMFHIDFKPHEDMALTGSDPLNILTELATLGDISVQAQETLVPKQLELLDPHKLYLSWHIELGTESSLDDIKDVFMFVEDVAEINIQKIAGVHAAEADASSSKNTIKEEKELVATPMDDRRKDERRQQDDRRQKKTKDTSEYSSYMRVSVDKIDSLINLVGELVTSNAMVVQQTSKENEEDNPALREALSHMSTHTRELQERIMSIRMMPIDFAFSRFPRMVRDTAKKLDKQVKLETEGGQTELDKTVIEKMVDPLTHLVRNAIDHGIESPEERRAKGKDEEGTVSLNAYYKGGNVIIDITDDGKGLDKAAILNKALEKGLITEETHLSDQEIFKLIFENGFSTAQQISDVSGRGVGMDVVYKNIQALGGNIHVESKDNEGTLFSISLPLTLAILDGMMIRIGKETYIVPLLNILESIKPTTEHVQRLKNDVEIMNVRGEYLPLLRLRRAFPVEKTTDAPSLENAIAIIIESDHNKIALLVDELLGEQQVVIKSLETNYKSVEGISGATILGDGSIALILDLSGLVRLSQREGRYSKDPQFSTLTEDISAQANAITFTQNKQNIATEKMEVSHNE